MPDGLVVPEVLGAAVVVLALVLAVTEGLHGAAGIIATSVATRALLPRAAVLLAGAVVLLGGLLGGLFVAVRVPDVVSVPSGEAGLLLLGAALLGALAWNLLTWWRGLPTSTTHALLGGLAGAALAAPAAQVRWAVLLDGVLLPALLVVAVAAVLGGAVVVALLWLLRGAMPARAHRRLRTAQVVAAAVTAVGHGAVDAQRTAAVVVMGLVVAGGGAEPVAPPTWTVVVAAAALAAGTASGGWRIVRTVGERLAPLDVPHAFAAQSATAVVLHAAAVVTGTPVSTSLAVCSAVVGASGVPDARRVRWRVVRRVALAWLVTPVATALLAAGAHALLSPLV
ncbi:inorganic phosphate transporter [Pseudokineococcus basanitobsidens]|uniref:Inorganic phosphate transporter n=1 Tax=Pseudokineococcus basanitobsidens TaxID=1926649 RepID=A0ABU8RNX2_9ACTN